MIFLYKIPLVLQAYIIVQSLSESINIFQAKEKPDSRLYGIFIEDFTVDIIVHFIVDFTEDFTVDIIVHFISDFTVDFPVTSQQTSQ